MTYSDELPWFEKFKSNPNRRYTAREHHQKIMRHDAQRQAYEHGCKKTSFPSKGAAQDRMKQLNSWSDPSQKTLRTAYQCPHCHSWHMSSQVRRSRSNRPWLRDVSIGGGVSHA